MSLGFFFLFWQQTYKSIAGRQSHYMLLNYIDPATLLVGGHIPVLEGIILAATSVLGCSEPHPVHSFEGGGVPCFCIQTKYVQRHCPFHYRPWKMTSYHWSWMNPFQLTKKNMAAGMALTRHNKFKTRQRFFFSIIT